MWESTLRALRSRPKSSEKKGVNAATVDVKISIACVSPLAISVQSGAYVKIAKIMILPAAIGVVCLKIQNF
jgi:hypothetical protein